MAGGEAAPAPDVEELVARLRKRVEDRRRSGAYLPELEQQMTAHFRRILNQRPDARPLPDVEAAVNAVREALPLQAARISMDSGIPGGQALHKAIGKVVSRQTHGTLQQVQGFAQHVQAALEALALAVVELSRTVQSDIGGSLDALYEQQAAQDRTMARLAGGGALLRASDFQPWYSSKHFEEAFRGTREEILERYRELAQRFAGLGPVLDIGCGRGEFLELLGELGVEATGLDFDGEMVKAASGRGLQVIDDEAIRYLSSLDNNSLGGVAMIQVVEHLSAQEIVDFVALAADKVRPGGKVFVETINPQSLYVFAHAFYLDPTHIRPVHPAYLAFLFREAGFVSVDIEWRSPPPADDVLEHAPEDSPAASVHNTNVQRLNELLFAPQDYLIAAVR